VQLSVSVDLKGFNRAMDRLVQEQVPGATARGLTWTAKIAQADLQTEIAKKFDRPTRFTLGSVYVSPATTKRLVATVALQDKAKDSSNKPVQWLSAEVRGGARRQKGIEVLLQARGLLPTGYYVVPTSFARLDQYGNVPGTVIASMLSQLQARSVFNMDKNETAKSKTMRNRAAYRGKKVLSRYFVVMPGGTKAPGIWERINAGGFVGPLTAGHNSVRPILLYVRQAPRYAKRLDFDGIVKASVHRNIEKQFDAAMAAMLKKIGGSS
jgi:hypothetical protein